MLQQILTAQLKYFSQLTASIKPETLLTNLFLAACILALTYLWVKALCYLADRLLGSKRRSAPQTQSAADADREIISPHLVQMTRAFCNIVIQYGSYLIAILIILELFNIKIISAADLKIVSAKTLKIVIIILGAKLLTSFSQMAVRQIFTRHVFHGDSQLDKRYQTLKILLHNILTYLFFFVAGLMILEVLGVNTAAILAGAGIIGLAIGFGAQSLVKDIIGGFFIVFENQLQVGDLVAIGNTMGTVEEVGLRTCKIRHWTGMLHIIPNGEIKQVTNYNRGQMMAVVTMNIAYEEDVDRASALLQQEADLAQQEITDILASPVVQAINELNEYAVQLRIVAPTTAGKQSSIERELRRRFKYALDRAGIKIPHQ